MAYTVPSPRSSGERFSSSGVLGQFGRNATPDLPGLMSPVLETNASMQEGPRKRTTYADYLLHVREVTIDRSIPVVYTVLLVAYCSPSIVERNQRVKVTGGEIGRAHV